MDIGEMRHRVWLQSRSESQDSEGGVVATWPTLAYLFAAIDPMTGREVEIAAQTQSLATHRITIRWQKLFGYADLTKMRFVSNAGSIFNIESTQERDLNHRYIVCYAILASGRNPQSVAVNDLHQTLYVGSEPLLVGA